MPRFTFFALPVPGQKIQGHTRVLGTVRTHMHKASLTALAAWIREDTDVAIVDMQTQAQEETAYGELDLGGLKLTKCRYGAAFSAVRREIEGSDIVGVSANFTHSRRVVADFLAHVRTVRPDTVRIVGGTDATADPRFYLRNGADIVVKGEGELVLRAVVRAWPLFLNLEQIANIAYWRAGEIVENPNFFLRDQQAVDDLPPHALDLIRLEDYSDTGEGRPPYGLPGPFISVETSRGCAQACSFCATPSTKGRFRFMSLERIRQHFEYYKSRGVRTLLFQEDNVLSRIHRRGDGSAAYPEGRRELLEMFRLAQDMRFSWEFTNGLEFGQLIGADRIDQELIDALFWHEVSDGEVVGCYRATVPFEDLSDEHSQLFRKLKPFAHSKRVVKALAATGVHSLAFNLIIGRPSDDERVLSTTCARAREIGAAVAEASRGTTTYFNVYNLSLLPGTVDFKRYQQLLAFDLEWDPEVITFYLGCLRTPHFTPLEITQARGTLAQRLNGACLIGEFDEIEYITSPRFEKLFA